MAIFLLVIDNGDYYYYKFLNESGRTGVYFILLNYYALKNLLYKEYINPVLVVSFSVLSSIIVLKFIELKRGSFLINIKKKIDCCGCNACGDICPTRAISFNVDNEGFWYPNVDHDKCINCGLCEKTCPILNSDELKVNDKNSPICYAAENKSIRTIFASTSGGIFSALAENMYRKSGYVGGAIHNKDFSVSHYISNDKNDLVKLRRSKDLQSNAEGFYKKVKELLNRGEYVLVCGLPCQMAGLKAFLGKDYKNLITIDLICLGVNSPKVWQAYLRDVEKKHNSKIIYTENKSKEYGWRNLTQKFIFENGEEFFDTKKYSLFIQGYVHTHLYCRPSCYECKFKGFPRIADITIGDFWGVEKFKKNMDKDLGTSVILINSDKGEQYFNEIKRRINFEKIQLDWILKGNKALLESISCLSEKRDIFFKDLEIAPFENVIGKYIFRKKSFKEKIKDFLRKGKEHLKFIKKIVMITRLSPKALYQTIYYSGIRNLYRHKGIIFGTNCITNISKKSFLEIKGLLVLGYKDRFPNSNLETRLLIADGGKLSILGDMIIGYGSDIEILEQAEFVVHGSKLSNSDTNIGFTVICGEYIELMSDVSIGRNVLIRDCNGNHYLDMPAYRTSRPVVIGEHVWLCESCTIMPGVRIGRGSIVGAMSVVTQSIPNNCLVNGSPAKIMEKNILWKN